MGLCWVIRGYKGKLKQMKGRKVTYPILLQSKHICKETSCRALSSRNRFAENGHTAFFSVTVLLSCGLVFQLVLVLRIPPKLVATVSSAKLSWF